MGDNRKGRRVVVVVVNEVLERMVD